MKRLWIGFLIFVLSGLALAVYPMKLDDAGPTITFGMISDTTGLPVAGLTVTNFKIKYGLSTGRLSAELTGELDLYNDGWHEPTTNYVGVFEEITASSTGVGTYTAHLPIAFMTGCVSGQTRTFSVIDATGGARSLGQIMFDPPVDTKLVNGNVPTTQTALAGAVWDVEQSLHTAAGTMGDSQNPPITAKAVWNELKAGYAGNELTFGGALNANFIKCGYLPAATAGTAGGLFIAGTNAATSITTGLTSNLIGNITGNMTGNITGNLSGSVGSVTGGATAAALADLKTCLVVLDTTIATLATQSSFTLTAGSADNNAYNGCTAFIVDASVANQVTMVSITDYTGSTKTVTLAVPGDFTVAPTDRVIILPKIGANIAEIGGSVLYQQYLAGALDGGDGSTIAANVTKIKSVDADTAISNNVMNTVIENSLTFKEIFRLITAQLIGKTTYSGGVLTFYAQDGVTARLRMTLSGNNRTASENLNDD